ncbi:MAG: hypothetical protein ACE5IC_04440 [Candidatus Brocadiales bacterium]
MLVGSKGLTIISIIMGLVAIFSLGLAVTATSKYRTHKQRVTELEERILLSKEAMLKIPQVQLKAQEEAAARQAVEEELDSAKEEMEALQEEFEEFKHEAELVAVGKAAAERLLQQSNEALKIARTDLAAAEEKLAALEEENAQMEKKIAALDLDVRAAETKIRDLTRQLGGESASLYKSESESTEVTLASGHGENKVVHLGFGLAVTGHEVTSGISGELHTLRARVVDLTNELVSLTKAKISAEKALTELQQQLASR